ncbi:TPA: hypothetical protein EYP70_01515 [Candidatus Bathyarchaeota archaeon]|nr:hypothetical protein [Candidatus Bathyarchaeota archaeon]
MTLESRKGTQGDIAYYDEFPKKHKLVIDIHHHYNPLVKDFVNVLLKDMSAAGVHMVCLFSSRPNYGERESKDWKKIFKDYYDRIIGFGTINPGRLPESKPEMIDEYYSRGFKGIKFLRPTKRYDHDDFLVYYEKAEDYDMPVLFHTGVIARKSVVEREDVSSAYMRPVYLDRIARWCPKLRIVAAHMGDPWFSEAYNTSQKNPLLWLDFSGKGIWLKAKAIREHLWIRLRPEKLVFGLDEPSSQYARLIYAWDTIFYEMGLTQEQRDMIFGGTAAKILGINI